VARVRSSAALVGMGAFVYLKPGGVDTEVRQREDRGVQVGLPTMDLVGQLQPLSVSAERILPEGPCETPQVLGGTREV